MISAKKGKVSLSVHSTKLVGDVAVCVSIPFDCSECAMCRLCGGTGCPCKGAESSCVAFAVFLNIRNALCGDPIAISKSKVSGVRCGTSSGCFVVSWKMKGTVSGVRKALGIALKACSPGKLYGAYNHCAQSIGLKSKREHFNHCAAGMNASLNRGVDCYVVGNIKAEKSHLEDMVEVLSGKLKPSDVVGSKSAPESSPCVCEGAVVKQSGWKAFVTRDYIMSKARGLVPSVCCSGLLIPIKQKQWDTLSKRLSAQVSVYVEQKYKKLGDNLGSIMAYHGVVCACLCPKDIDMLCSSKISPANVASAIKEGL